MRVKQQSNLLQRQAHQSVSLYYQWLLTSRILFPDVTNSQAISFTLESRTSSVFALFFTIGFLPLMIEFTLDPSPGPLMGKAPSTLKQAEWQFCYLVTT
jgi:hypothetical protein